MTDYTAVKEEGNKCFNENKYGEAAACYTRALSLSSVTGNNKAVLLKNRAACYLKLDKHNEAIADCTSGILIYSVNTSLCVVSIVLTNRTGLSALHKFAMKVSLFFLVFSSSVLMFFFLIR